MSEVITRACAGGPPASLTLRYPVSELLFRAAPSVALPLRMPCTGQVGNTRRTRTFITCILVPTKQRFGAE